MKSNLTLTGNIGATADVVTITILTYNTQINSNYKTIFEITIYQK